MNSSHLNDDNSSLIDYYDQLAIEWAKKVEALRKERMKKESRKQKLED